MRPAAALTILMVLGMAVRLSAGWIRPADLRADNDGYLAHAEMVIQGEGFAGPYTHQPTAFRPPAYPISIAALRWIGFSAAASVLIITGLCGIVIIGLTWKLGQQLGLPNSVVVFATALTTFDPLLLRYSILPMTEVPAAAVLLAAVVALKAGEKRFLNAGKDVKDSCSRIRENSEVGDGSDRKSHDFRYEESCSLLLLSGILFGIGSLVRPIILVSCAMLVLWRIIRSLKNRADFRRGIMTAILPAVAALLAVSPWIIRNAIQFHKFIPATTHGGYTLALGNNTDFYRDVIDGDVPFPWPGPQLDAWQKNMIADAEAQGVPIGDEPALDAWHYQQAFAAIQSRPTSFLKACLLRLRRFCAITPGADDSLPGVIRALTAVWYGVIAIGVIAAVGQSILNCRRRGLPRSQQCNSAGNGFADLWFVILSFMLLHSVYWTDTRMRAPVMPFVCLIAAFGLSSILRKLNRHFIPKTPVELPS